MADWKRILAAGALCAVCLTGCASSDKAADLAREIPVQILNTEKEIETAMAQVPDVDGNHKSWIFNEKSHLQLKNFIQFLKSEQDRGTISIGESGTEDFQKQLLKADCLDDDVFAGNERQDLWWSLELGEEKDLLPFFQRLEAIGFTGVYDLVSDRIKLDKLQDDEFHADISFVCNGMSFEITFFDKEVSLSVSMSTSIIGYPESMKKMIEDKLQGGFSIQDICAGGYIQAIVVSSDGSAAENPYEKNCVFYLKDGELLQIDMYIHHPQWLNEKNRKQLEGHLQTFFSEQEAETLAGIMEMFGVSRTEALDQMKKLGRESGKDGSVGNVKWNLERVESKYYIYPPEKDWHLLIQ